ncbi:hypothetical protein J3F84DRAFT_369718 [Trichoderma pleuroticola]
MTRQQQQQCHLPELSQPKDQVQIRLLPPSSLFSQPAWLEMTPSTSPITARPPRQTPAIICPYPFPSNIHNTELFTRPSPSPAGPVKVHWTMAGTCPECFSPSSSGPCPIGDERNCPGMQNARKPPWEMPSQSPWSAMPSLSAGRAGAQVAFDLIFFFSSLLPPPLSAVACLLYTESLPVCLKYVTRSTVASGVLVSTHQDPQTLKPHHSISSSPPNVRLHDACMHALYPYQSIFSSHCALAIRPMSKKAATSIP